MPTIVGPIQGDTRDSSQRSGAAAGTLISHAREQFGGLLAACGLACRTSDADALVDSMMAPWGHRPRGQVGPWVSDISDDHTPFELSFVIGVAPEVRLLVETQTDDGSLNAMWRAGLDRIEHIVRDHPRACARLAAIEEIFRPSEQACFAVWHSVVLGGAAPPMYKVYLDAQASGRWRGASAMEEALCALGFSRVWPAMTASALARGPALDEPKYVSLDLDDAPGARVKLYVRHHEATVSDLTRALGGDTPLARSAGPFCAALTGGRACFDRRPVFTCHAFTAVGQSEPSARTLYLPVAAYAGDDAEIAARLRGYLHHRSFAVDTYDRALAQRTGRDLSSRTGLHSYIGLREEPAGSRISVYFSPDLCPYDVPDAPPPPPPRAEEIVHRFEHEVVLADHPFIRRLAREPVNLGHLWLLLANFWESVVQDFPRRLAHVAAVVDDDRVRCIVAKQLHDELGEGDFARAHKGLFSGLLDAVEPYRLSGDDDLLLAPGRAFGRDLGRVLLSTDQYEAIGALMLVEIYGKQVDVFMGQQFRRQDRVGGDSLRWLELHEDLEVDHADDSSTLAHLLPDTPGAVAAAWAGAEAVADAARRYFDGLYALCYP